MWLLSFVHKSSPRRYYVTSFDSAMSYLASDEFQRNVEQALHPKLLPADIPDAPATTTTTAE
jgi:hypothetical protein